MKLLWYIVVFIAELCKGKLKPIITYCIDPAFRREVEALRPLIGYRLGRHHTVVIPFGAIVPTHKVHYPEYVAELTTDLYFGRAIPPIMVTKSDGKYKVINGNHRWNAMKASGKYAANRLVQVILYDPI